MTWGSPGWPAGLPAVLDAVLDRAAAGGPFGTARSAELDAREEFPAEECAILDACGLTHAYVPAELGGAPGGLPELVASLWRIAGRDVTVAVAHGKTFLGAVSVWVAGTQVQRESLARRILDESATVSWGLTEPERGSDLLSGRLTATPAESGGWLLDGVKWPINNATRGRFITVLARTAQEGGTRGFSLFLVDKNRLPAGSWTPLPKEPTHGIRGADISGIRFTRAAIPADSVIGRVGDGIETVLRSLQLTRTMCASLSLGAGEHALRLAYGFAEQRVLYGTTLLTLPSARRVLGRAAASLALAEAASLTAARAAHCLTGEMSVVSALVKAGVPEIVQQLIDDLAELMGARGLLVAEHADGMFQKLERDHRIVAIFDGTTTVNRAALIVQFPVLARLSRSGAHDAAGLAAACDPSRTLPPLDVSALRLVSRTGCSVVQALPAAVARLGDLAASGSVPKRAHELASELAVEAESVAQAMSALPPATRGTPPEAFAVARRFEVCFAGACAAHQLIAALEHEECVTRPAAALERSLELLRPGYEAPVDAYEGVLGLVPAGTDATVSEQVR